MALVKVAEAARELSCSADTLYNLIRQGKIQPYRLGPRSTRVDLDELKRAAQQAPSPQQAAPQY